MSSVWAGFHEVVWAQPSIGQTNKAANKRTSWWPGIVIAGDVNITTL